LPAPTPIFHPKAPQHFLFLIRLRWKAILGDHSSLIHIYNPKSLI
jgi:hypothetical protein